LQSFSAYSKMVPIDNKGSFLFMKKRQHSRLYQDLSATITKTKARGEYPSSPLGAARFRLARSLRITVNWIERGSSVMGGGVSGDNYFPYREESRRLFFLERSRIIIDRIHVSGKISHSN